MSIYIWFLLVLADTAFAAIYRPSPLGNTDAISGLIFCINQANSTPEDDIIDLGGTSYTLTTAYAPNPAADGDSGLPEIVNNGKLSIVNGAISRSRSADNTTNAFRLIFIQANASLSLNNVTLEHGNTGDSSSPSPNPSPLFRGGAIINLGTLFIENSVLTDNTAILGGAIFNYGTIAGIESSSISNNLAFHTAGAQGGGIHNDGFIDFINNTSINYNTVNGNQVSFGGGIYNGGLFVSALINSITNSTIANNSVISSTPGMTPAQGGGIYNAVSILNLTPTFVGSIINQISNTTIYNNAATQGGGIFNASGASVNAQIISLNNSTISGNGNSLAGNSEGGGILNNGIINNLISNILAANSAVTYPDIYSANLYTQESNNLLSDSTGSNIIDGFNNDIVTSNSLQLGLGAFQNNGGPTFTIALIAGSVAMNNGINTPSQLKYDQRGAPFRRVSCALPDIGAYELQFCHPLLLK